MNYDHDHHDVVPEEDVNSVIDPVHYHLKKEPFDYIHDNDMGFAEGNVIKYISRWRYKDGGLNDLYKAKQYIEMLIEKEEKQKGVKNGKSRS
tara:strand:+ start:2894 stop:3169 length:276 start_codon:yes stop_codon:yes gene_type:complete